MRNWDILIIFGAFVAILFIGGWNSCSEKPVVHETKTEFKVEQAKEAKANLKPIIIIQEKEVVKWRDKWHVAKRDTIVKTDTVIHRIVQICDSALTKDSLLISSLKQEIRIDSSIIQNQDKIIDSKNLEVLAAKKETRRQKRRTIIVTTLAVIIAGLAITK